jgi:arylsulfatase A-like enzyme
MMRRWLLVLLLLFPPSVLCHAQNAVSRRPPNIVFILADDLGYGDLGCYGGKIPTPHLDQLAREGTRLTDFYVAQAVCSASRTAFLTGRYPQRLGIHGALGPSATHGVSIDDTLPQLLKKAGYATACYGKWHLGHQPQFLPTHRGFDDYFGLPYSNDMGPLHPTQKFPPLPLIEGDRVIAENPDQRLLTTWYTQRAVRFIDDNAGRPFFLYVAHTMPHVPLFVSDERAGKTGQGLYADVVAELDWSVGQIAAALERHKLTDETIFIFSSDNGPWIAYGNHAGSTGGLREGKMTTFEGGVRVPLVVRYPAHVPPGASCRAPLMSIDLMPTLLRWANIEIPKGLDGADAGPLLEGRPDASAPHDALLFYWDDELQAVRQGPWKLHLSHSYMSLVSHGRAGKPGVMLQKQIGPSLYNLDDDPAETKNLADTEPQVVERLRKVAEAATR